MSPRLESARVMLVASATVSATAASASTALAAGAIAAAWVFIGPTGFSFALVTHLVLMAWVSSIISPRVRIPDLEWLRVRPWELRLYPALGVRLFGKLLDVTGWNRVVEKERGFSGTREGLPGLDQHTRRSEIGHGLCIVATVALALGVLSTGVWHGAAWLIVLGLVVHLYPVLLQRLVRARIQYISARLAGRASQPTQWGQGPR